MGDQVEIWQGMKKAKQDAKAQRRDYAPILLKEAGIIFTEHNDGAHLVLDTHLGFIDFWPGTTKWKTRTFPPIEGHGMAKLLLIVSPIV